jgi:hypothetical protein
MNNHSQHAPAGEILFPEGPNGPGDGWEVMGKQGKSSGQPAAKPSALSGPYQSSKNQAARAYTRSLLNST